jgi:hypothetical protein
MATIQDTVKRVLQEAALRLEAAQFSDYAQDFRKLAAQADEPCVVAVAGRTQKASYSAAIAVNFQYGSTSFHHG